MRTRFAPSPTGPLHLGHAYSALVAHDLARAHGGTFLLRIEDIDQSRARIAWETQIYDDLSWLGCTWPTPVMRQSERMAAYSAALDKLWRDELLYPCYCNRRDILDAANAPQEGSPGWGPDGLVYPGTCANRPRCDPERPRDVALRLDMTRASTMIGAASLQFEETGVGPDGAHGEIRIDTSELPQTVGDIVLARRDMGTSYHLSVVLDDAEQGISHVVRGEDLFTATQIHVVLQQLLVLPTPLYHHHKLIRDETGKRLAKRDDARAIRKYREDGLGPDDIRARLGL